MFSSCFFDFFPVYLLLVLNRQADCREAL